MDTLLRIRAGKENERGPIYMEPAIAALHSIKRGGVGLEAGFANGVISLYARVPDTGVQLVENQLYAQYPDVDIERCGSDPFELKPGEEVVSLDLHLTDPEVFPIKRHPQFDDLLTRTNVDSISGITSALARYPMPGMRGHVQVVLTPLGGSFRRRAVRFLPLLERGLAKLSPAYAEFFTRVQLARGWQRLLLLPFAIFMGGFRAWPGFSKFFAGVGVNAEHPTVSHENEEDQRAAARSHDREDAVAGAFDKVNRLLFLCNVRVSVIAPAGQRKAAEQKLREIAGSFLQFSLPQSNSFKLGHAHADTALPTGIRKHPFILSVEEVATLWHLPTIQVQTPNLDWVLSKKLEPPVNIPVAGVTDKPEDLTILGAAVFRGTRTEFGIRPDDRRRHLYAIGKTGMGKSTLLENMIFSDVHSGKGIGVIDPHGDLIEAILRFLPASRSNDVILFDPADKDFPVSFNILDCPDPDQRPLVASGIMSVFTKLWPDVWSGRMEHILRNTLLALLENEGTSMLGIPRMYADTRFREKIVGKVTDPLVRSFWKDEYEGWSEKYRTEAVSAIQNKVGQLLSTPLIRNIVGQVQSRLNVRFAMDSGKIVLVNLSKGKLGEDTSAFLGSMLVTKFQIDAMSRSDIPENERRDFYLYVDEFQNFATESFATILSEARKYRLCLTMANQYIGQLQLANNSTALKDAVFGNVGSMVSFQVGSDDAEVFSLQYEELVLPKDILSLPKYHAYMRLMIDGMPSKPFSVQTLPPPKFEQDEGRMATIRKLSRERYSEARSTVEERIRAWAATAETARSEEKAVQKAGEKEEEERAKARKKNMTLEAYRAWRDRELWTNEFNALRKKEVLGETMTASEQTSYTTLKTKLEASGGVPELSKGLQELKAKKEGTYVPKKKAEEGK